MQNTKPSSALKYMSATSETNELSKQKALYQLMEKLSEAEISIHNNGTISITEIEKELELK